VLTLKSTLISLQSLLCSPEPNDPQDAEVAKHYMTSRTSFEDTARYWTHVYAGGPALSSGQGVGVRDEVAIAGLDKAHVDQFETIGFERSKVVRVVILAVLPQFPSSKKSSVQIDVLRRLNYRGANVAKIPDDKVVEELLKA
jgi:ubiquitin-conjugating enzyme (huntingtin interacting protein 2)